MPLFGDERFAPIRPNRIGEQLPYFEFEDDNSSPFYRVHLLQDGSLGVCWKAPVPPSYSYDDGQSMTANELRTFVESLPADFQVQLVIVTHNNLTDKMRQYLDNASSLERGQLLKQSRAEKLLNAGFDGYQVSENAYSMLRDSYLLVSLKAPEMSNRLGLISHFINIVYEIIARFVNIFRFNLADAVTRFLDDTIRSNMVEFQEILLTAESTLNAMFQIERMDLAQLKKHYWTAFCPNYREPRQDVKVDPYIPFNEQIFPLPIEQDFDLVKFGDDYHGVVMLAMMPDTVGLDYLGIIRRTIATHHIVFCNIVQANQLVEKVQLTLSSALRQRISNMFSREEASIFAEETSQVRARMFSGRKIVYMMFGVIVHGASRAEVEERLFRLSSNFKKLSVVPDIERSMCLQAISYSWPLVWDHRYTKPFARTRRVLSDDLVDLLPIHGHWGGHKDAQAVYANRDGEITFFNHTSPDFVNWHYAITGTSGSGKSFAVVDLVLQLFASGIEKQYLLTIKDDYDRFAETMGRLIIIDLDSQGSCINPFGGEINKNRLQQWSNAVELMLQKGGGWETARDEQRLIEQVVQYAYDLVPTGDVLRPTWIREAFYKFPYISEEQRSIGMQNAEEIGSYCRDGVYGRLFDAEPSVTERDKLVVFNLQNVLSEKIADVIIYSIFSMLDNVMYSGDRKERKHLLIDEMISMVSSKSGQTVSNQLKRAFRTYRSLNCMCGIATQNEEDLTTEVGQAIIGNITKRIMLKPRREMIPLLMESLSLRSERHAMNIASLETKPGFFSEFYLMSPHGEVVCRLLTDRLTYALATTTPDDVAELRRLRNESGGDWWQATLKFSQIYPHGVRAAFKARQEKNERSRAA